jgi:hypothetical protein
MSDPSAFYAAHPECVVTGEMFEKLEPQIRIAVTRIDRLARINPDLAEDLAAQIRLRIIEASAGYRCRDAETGVPIYDYLDQSDSYIVEHAAGAVSSQQRRERKIAERLRTVSMEGMTQFMDISDDAEVELGDSTSPAYGDFSDTVAEEIDLERFTALVRSRLSTAEKSVFDLLVIGFTRAEVHREMNLSRQSVHPHMRAIQNAAKVAMAKMGQPERRRRYIGSRRTQ